MAVSSITAIEFSHLGIRHARVFYQYSNEKTLRESCYRKDLGWFVRGDGVITSDAKEKSPITATCWIDDSGDIKIGVFYIDERNSIRWRQGGHQITSKWTLQPMNDIEAVSMGQSSQLAAINSSDGKSLHLFYQGPLASGMKAPLRELRFDRARQKWESRLTMIAQDAILGTRMSAIWDSAKQLVRLYYQDHRMLLREVCWASTDGKWTSASTTVKDRLLADAPITAVGWATLTKGSTNFMPEIRIFTVLAADEGRVSQVSWSNRTWKTRSMRDVPYGEESDIAACRGTGIGALQRMPICLFYHWRRQGIEMVQIPVDDSPSYRVTPSDISCPCGIPISIGGDAAQSPNSDDNNGKKDSDETRGSEKTKKPDNQGDHGQSGTADTSPLLRYLDINLKNPEGYTPLHLAVMAGDEATARLLIHSGADVKITDSRNYAALHIAVEKGNEALLRLLLEKGSKIEDSSDDGPALDVAVLNRKDSMVKLLLDLEADVYGMDKEGNMPLHIAAKLGDLSLVKLLLARGAYVNSQNNAGESPLYLAASQGHEEMSAFLISRKGDTKLADNEGNLPLHAAAYNGKQTVAQLLIDKGAKVDCKNNADDTPLYKATDANNGDMVRFLLDNSAAIKGTNSDGNSALHLAAAKGYAALIRLLCERGADIHQRNGEEKMPIHSAAAQCHTLPAFDALLEKGADINSKGAYEVTPLMVAVGSDNEDSFQYLIDKGADRNCSNKLKDTALHDAIRFERKTMIRTLLDKGVDVNAPGYNKITPLLKAAAWSGESTARMLIQKGANVNAIEESTNYDGRVYQLGTPLHYAATRNNKAMAELLLDNGAYINSNARFGQTPLHLAACYSSSDPATVQLLVERGANVNAKDDDGKTPLAMAQSMGISVAQQQIQRFLISKGATV